MSIRGKLTLVTLSAFIALYSIVGGISFQNPTIRSSGRSPTRGLYPQLRIF